MHSLNLFYKRVDTDIERFLKAQLFMKINFQEILMSFTLIDNIEPRHKFY